MDIRFRLFLVMGMAALVAGVWSLPYWWTIVNPDSAVAACLPGLDVELCAEYATLSNRQKEAYETLYYGDEDDEIDGKPDWTLALLRARFAGVDSAAPNFEQPFEPPVGSQVIASGTFSSVDEVRVARGEFNIYQTTDGQRLMRILAEPPFESSRAPDVRIIFTRNPDPTNERGVGNDYIEVGILQGNIAGQTYNIPTGVDFSRFPVMALYSREYDAVVGTAAIR